MALWVCIFYEAYFIWCPFSTGKPRARQAKIPKHNVDSGGVINISDDSSSDSDGMETDSNSSPDSLLDNDDVIFVNHTNGQTGSPLVLCRVYYFNYVWLYDVYSILMMYIGQCVKCALNSSFVIVHSQDRGNEAGPPTQNIYIGKRTTSQHVGWAHR